MFGETTMSYVKIWNDSIETTIYKCLFRVPGKNPIVLNLFCYVEKDVKPGTLKKKVSSHQDHKLDLCW